MNQYLITTFFIYNNQSMFDSKKVLAHSINQAIENYQLTIDYESEILGIKKQIISIILIAK